MLSLGQVIGLAHTNIIGAGVVDEHGAPLRSPGHIISWMDIVASLLWRRSCTRPLEQRAASDAPAEGLCGEVGVSLANFERRRPRPGSLQGLGQGRGGLELGDASERLSEDDAELVLGMLSTSELIQQSPYIDDDQVMLLPNKFRINFFFECDSGQEYNTIDPPKTRPLGDAIPRQGSDVSERLPPGFCGP